MYRKHFLRRSVFQSGAPLCQKQKNRECINCKSRLMSFTWGRANKKAKMFYFTWICAIKMGAKRFTTRERAVLRSMRFPYAGSKIIIFLFINNSFCAAGEIRTS